MPNQQFPCKQCGSQLVYEPGSAHLTCTYCGFKNLITSEDAPAIRELDFDHHLELAASEAETMEVMAILCTSCGAETTLNPNVVSDICPFCDTPLVQTKHTEKIFKPQGVVPFKLSKDDSVDAYRKWLRGLWFAPNKLKDLALEEHFTGVYYPFWTYDSDTFTRYSGQRGDYYYTTKRYQANENGRMVTKHKQVRHTRWSKRRGAVENVFDDVLVAASKSVAHFYTKKLEPWDLDELEPYTDAYLSGFKAESYSILLDHAFKEAQHIMDGVIVQSIYRDIGGDEQRINRKETTYDDVTFKHILLPVWINAYHYNDKVYRFMVNGATGRVHGERPYSAIKIFFAILGALLLAAVIAIIVNLSEG